jgi:hypothetical protein
MMSSRVTLFVAGGEESRIHAFTVHIPPKQASAREVYQL